MAAPLIIHDQRDRPDQQEIVLMLADFSFTPPEQIFADAQKGRQHARHGRRACPRSSGRHGRSKGRGHEHGGRQARPERRELRRVPGQRPHARRSRGGQGRARRARAAAHHQQLFDERLSHRSGRARGRIDRRRRVRGCAGRGPALPDRGGAAARYSSSDSGRRREPIRCWRCSRAGTNKRASSCAAEMHRLRASPILPPMASSALTLDLERRLRAAAPLKPRKADRRHTLNLTGNMASYSWSLNNVVWTTETPPLPMAQGERVELLFVNQTPMPHPMHLHGHEFQVVEINEQKLSGAVRDTVLVPPGHRVLIAFDANNPGHLGAALPFAVSSGDGDVRHVALRLARERLTWLRCECRCRVPASRLGVSAEVSARIFDAHWTKDVLGAISPSWLRGRRLASDLLAAAIGHWPAPRWLLPLRSNMLATPAWSHGIRSDNPAPAGQTLSDRRLGWGAVLSREPRRHADVHRHHRCPRQRQRRDQDRRGRARRLPAAARSRFAEACWMAGRLASCARARHLWPVLQSQIISATSWRCRTSKPGRWRGYTPSGMSKTRRTIFGRSASA